MKEDTVNKYINSAVNSIDAKNYSTAQDSLISAYGRIKEEHPEIQPVLTAFEAVADYNKETHTPLFIAMMTLAKVYYLSGQESNAVGTLSQLLDLSVEGAAEINNTLQYIKNNPHFIEQFLNGLPEEQQVIYCIEKMANAEFDAFNDFLLNRLKQLFDANPQLTQVIHPAIGSVLHAAFARKNLSHALIKLGQHSSLLLSVQDEQGMTPLDSTLMLHNPASDNSAFIQLVRWVLLYDGKINPSTILNSKLENSQKGLLMLLGEFETNGNHVIYCKNVNDIKFSMIKIYHLINTEVKENNLSIVSMVLLIDMLKQIYSGQPSSKHYMEIEKYKEILENSLFKLLNKHPEIIVDLNLLTDINNRTYEQRYKNGLFYNAIGNVDLATQCFLNAFKKIAEEPIITVEAFVLARQLIDKLDEENEEVLSIYTKIIAKHKNDVLAINAATDPVAFSSVTTAPTARFHKPTDNTETYKPEASISQPNRGNSPTKS